MGLLNERKFDDREIIPLIAKTLPNPLTYGVGREAPFRHWYAALMDYGAHFKATQVNPSRKSKHHAKQSLFKGSDRQLRGEIIRRLLAKKKMREPEILKLDTNPVRMHTILDALIAEGLLLRKNNSISISS